MTPNCIECHDTYVKQLEAQIIKHKAFEQQVEALVGEAENEKEMSLLH